LSIVSVGMSISAPDGRPSRINRSIGLNSR
jgi:hypothetical protein